MRVFRHFFESLLPPLVFRRRLPKAFNRVPIVVTQRAGLKYLFRKMSHVDPTLLKLAERHVKPGMTVWDIGANVGLFTFSAAARAGERGRVLALEADTAMVELLRKSARLQPASSASVDILAVGASESLAIRNFCLTARSSATNHLETYGALVENGAAQKQMILGVPLDWLAQHLALPDLIKIDVEGAELEVLKGAEELLKKRKPILLVEVRLDHASFAGSYLKKLGYRLIDGEEGKHGRPPSEEDAPFITVAIAA